MAGLKLFCGVEQATFGGWPRHRKEEERVKSYGENNDAMSCINCMVAAVEAVWAAHKVWVG